MRKLSHSARILQFLFASLFYTRMRRDGTRRDETRRSGYTERAATPERDTRFPSAAGYYFSRRIFPQMNFMKTVFALLINRSSGPPGFSSRVLALPRARSSRGRAAAFSNNIVSETAEKSRDSLPSPPPPSPGSSVRYVICVIYANPPRRYTPASLFLLIFATEKGRAWKNCWQIMTLARLPSCS